MRNSSQASALPDFPVLLVCFKRVLSVSCVCSVLASILRAWLDQCPEDFQEPPHYPCLHRLLEYLGKALPGSETLRRAEGLLEQLQTQAGMEETEGTLPLVQSLATYKKI